MTTIDLPAVLSAFLVSAGTLGRREAELRKRFRHIPWDDVLMELDILWKAQQAQRFTLDKKHIWRATDKLNV